MFPETDVVEIICPVKGAISSARGNKIGVDNTLNGNSYFGNPPIEMTILMVPRALSYVIPNQTSLWQGIHTDFSSLVKKGQF